MATVGFIGTGEITSALVQALARSEHQILVSERNREVSARLAATHADVSVAANTDVVGTADIVFLCLLADVARTVLPSLSFRREQTVISVMVDVPLAELREVCAPAEDIAIAIPLPTITLGGSPLPIYPDCAALHRLFGSRTVILPTASEVALNAHFAASALLSPLFDQLQSGAEWLASITGDADAAEAFISALFRDYFRLLEHDDKLRFKDVLAGLSTEGGLNATLRAHCTDKGVLAVLTDGLDSFRRRLGLPDTHPFLKTSSDSTPDNICYQLWRLDDNGNEFLVRESASREAIEQEKARLESGGHKQIYWIRPTTTAVRT